MAIVPTLLIGLGGVGSKVVDAVYDLIPPENRERIAVHVFDTNVNDIGKLEHLSKNQVTQTSTRWSVGQYLHYTDESVKEWFPHEVKLLRDKLLTEGAGQVRSVSRLAYRAAMEQGRLHELQETIRPIFQARDDGLVTSARVMIVSTLAGGTGAGLFLQMALYLRELLQTRFGKNVLIRGAFILPDVLAMTNTVPNRQWENIRANGYACFKELDAIQATLSGGSGAHKTLELEYKPGGRSVLEGRVPYEFVYLYDFENDNGENIGSFSHYLDQVIQTIFLQLFTPIAGGTYSIEDNDVLSVIEEEGENRYCGAGVARLVYPYEEVLEYGALQWATGSLTDEWLRIDRDFDEEYRLWELDLHNGVNRPEPRLADRYLKLLKSYGASTETPDPFFSEVYRSCHRLDEKARIDESKALSLLKAVDDEVARVIEDDEDVLQAEDRCRRYVNDRKLKDREHALQQILKTEEALLELEQSIAHAVHEHKVALVNSVVARACDNPSKVHGAAYQLHTYMLGEGGHDALHPVAIRYVLYDLQLRLEEALLHLRPDNEALLERIRRYEKVYDDPDTPNYTETPIDRIRQALRQPWMRRLFQNKFSEFVELYRDKSSKQLGVLREYKTARLRELVYTGVLGAVEEMLEEDWEPFFHNLRTVRNHLEDQRNQAAVAHEETTDPTTRYVMASKGQKDRLWENVRLNVARGVFPKEISRELYLAQYQRFCARHRDRRAMRKEKPEDTEVLYRQAILGWCRAQLRKQAALRLNIVQALKEEAGALDAGEDGYVIHRIRQIDHLARPFIPPPGLQENPPDPTAFWGLHPESLGQLSPEQQAACFRAETEVVSNKETQVIEDPDCAAAFSPFELIRYRTVYGLQAEDFPKLVAGDREHGIPQGTYYQAYGKRIQKLERSVASKRYNIVTPHLDKRWHVPAFMPGPIEREEVEETEDIQRAFLLGLIYALLQPVAKDRKEIWQYGDGSASRALSVDGRPVKGRLPDLYDALAHEPTIVDRVLHRAEEAREEDFDRYRKSTSPRFHRFYTGSVTLDHLPDHTNILDVVLRFTAGVRGNSGLGEVQLQLLDGLFEEITAYYDLYYGDAQRSRAGRMALRLMNKLWEESKARARANKRSTAYRVWSARIEEHRRKLEGRV